MLNNVDYSITANGSIIKDGNEYFPEQLIYYSNLLDMIYKKRCWEQLSDDAKIIAHFACSNDSVKLLTTKEGWTRERLIASFFRIKWGRLRVKKAIIEIKEFLKLSSKEI